MRWDLLIGISLWALLLVVYLVIRWKHAGRKIDQILDSQPPPRPPKEGTR